MPKRRTGARRNINPHDLIPPDINKVKRTNFNSYSMLVRGHYYIVGIANLLNPYFFPVPFSDLESAQDAWRTQFKSSTRFTIELGETIIKHNLRVAPYKMRKKLGFIKADLKYVYPPWVTTKQQRKDFRKIRRRYSRKYALKLNEET